MNSKTFECEMLGDFNFFRHLKSKVICINGDQHSIRERSECVRMEIDCGGIGLWFVGSEMEKSHTKRNAIAWEQCLGVSLRCAIKTNFVSIRLITLDYDKLHQKQLNVIKASLSERSFTIHR